MKQLPESDLELLYKDEKTFYEEKPKNGDSISVLVKKGFINAFSEVKGIYNQDLHSLYITFTESNSFNIFFNNSSDLNLKWKLNETKKKSTRRSNKK